jgi:UDP-N-acetylmuramoyl-L-alanyl-D-glutamate--2,6-diaminopimelate ligase
VAKILSNILNRVQVLQIHGNAEVLVQALAIDSRRVKAGSLFAAIVGWKQDGHQYIDSAIAAGAVVVLCSTMPASLHPGVTYVLVNNTSEALAYIAVAFYDHPSSRLKLVGVTGTNGKTTIATLLYQLFTALGYRCGLLSTVQNIVGTEVLASEFTTPDAISLNALLRQMVDAGCTHAFMECSSHAIHQHRITGLHFTGAIFSNISHDHLDYHKTFDEYIRVKKSFFDMLPASAFALTNADDKRGLIMLQNSVARKMKYALKTEADFKGKIIENNLTGLIMEVNGHEVHFRMIGEFNAYNLLAVFGAAVNLGEPAEAVLAVLSNLHGAEGRFDYTVSARQRVIGIVDYAHTPDALLNVLATINKLRRGNEKVITVVGAGGDRDKSKRPLMAAAACEYSDRAILTSDNPRTEDPQAILADMQADMKSEHKRRCLVIADRREAIKTAVMLADAGDIILVAGKGHEKYQEINGVKHHFDDKEELTKQFAEQEK